MNIFEYAKFKKMFGNSSGGESTGGSGGGIIDVAELPTENIDEKSIHRVEGKTELYMGVENTASFEPLSTQIPGGTINYFVVDTLPETLTPSSQETMTLYIYILSSTGIGYLDMGAGTMTIGTAFGSSELDKGWCDDIGNLEMSNETFGIWTAKGKEKLYIRKDGKWAELVTTDNVDVKEIVVVELAEIAEGETTRTLTNEQVKLIGQNRDNVVLRIPHTYSFVDADGVSSTHYYFVPLSPCLHYGTKTYFSSTFKDQSGNITFMQVEVSLTGYWYCYEKITLATT